ncbi:MAG: hypothetical protein HZA90_02100 [Verrucomicrobia bacterium]|nr:hypothetical protein [Verrucomicrobiota bacterium]
MAPSNSSPPALWNKKLHIYLGLYLLVFLWLFAGSGLLLNHSGWRFAEFWDKRKQATTTRAFEPGGAADDLGRASHILQQLGITGEIEWTQTSPKKDRFEFRVTRPGQMIEVSADLAKKQATLRETRVNGWGIVRMLHTFSGVQGTAIRPERDWLLTKLWSLSMDAVAVGLVFLVLSSVVMTWQRREKRLGSALALILGVLVGGFFVFGLRWL